MRIVELRIEDIAFGGKGVGREQGKAIFVPYTIEGELVSAELVREKKQFSEAELVEVRESSPDRVTPECPYFGRCGGCAYQHIGYEHQLVIKSRQVDDVLQRIGKLKDIPVRPIIPSPKPYGYRNRITVHAEDGVIGFFRRDSHRLIDVERCPISCDEVNRELTELRGRNPRDGHYSLRTSASQRVFSQTNDEVADALRDLVVDLIPPNQDLLIDGYCGAGFFAKALLDKFERVIGIDWDKFAIAAAKEDATEKESYIAGDVEDELASPNLTALGSQ
ncbi:MAG: class I SAM-dependent RNA methyltransferase, partial [Verrucomicrobia bacterium]|nr:class I SAM-dependent RNA methyltransferase [Verrucomicrobiota bacterium]